MRLADIPNNDDARICERCGQPALGGDYLCGSCRADSWETRYENRCGNCQSRLDEDDKYCKICGTKAGEGAFEPWQNIMQCIYGPEPVQRVHRCPSCRYTWETMVMIDNQRYCPKCGHDTNKPVDIDMWATFETVNATRIVPKHPDNARKEPTAQQLAEIFVDTLAIGSYDCATMPLSTLSDPRFQPMNSLEERMQAIYIPEQRIREIASCRIFPTMHRQRYCNLSVANTDSFQAAANLQQANLPHPNDTPVLVLNFANPVNPGGGVVGGARAQEEDLCRCSSLYVSLSSLQARPYYVDNAVRADDLTTGNALLSPNVTVFKDREGKLLDEPFTVAVLTMAAPYARDTSLDASAIKTCLRGRIRAMLAIACYFGYDRLVLGAWGCGAFGNDPEVVAGLFAEQLRDLLDHGVRYQGDSYATTNALDASFSAIRFAVLDLQPQQQTFGAFERGLRDLIHRTAVGHGGSGHSQDVTRPIAVKPFRSSR